MKLRNNLLLVLHLGNKCNLNCTYCYSEKKPKEMSIKTGIRAVNFSRDLISAGFYNSITIGFSGGEPLLYFETIKTIVAYARSNNINKFIICTNGILLDKRKVKFFAENNIVPEISIDGIKKAFMVNRCSTGSKWERVNKSLYYFEKYAEVFNKNEPDRLRIRITLTPESIKYLARSVEHFYRMPIGKFALITIMPAMSERLINEWILYSSKKDNIIELNKQFTKIAKLYNFAKNKNRPLNLAINECVPHNYTDLSLADGLRKISSCNAGSGMMGMDFRGKIYPCYLASANPESNQNFIIGNVYKGLLKKRNKSIKLFCGKCRNKKFSCLYWNKLATGTPDREAYVYDLVYNAWKNAVNNVRLLNKD